MARRVPFIAGNWKMHLDVEGALSLIRSLREGLDEIGGVEKAVFPSFVALHPVREILSGSSIKLGAQNMYAEDEGAFTGEVSPIMLKGLCEYVILGHSERRNYFGESDELINKKVKKALEHKIKPVLCVGEKLEERKRGLTEEVVRGQLEGCLSGIKDADGLVVAYEPVWAIGTGVPASDEDALRVIKLIRETLRELIGADDVRILYGGSVNKDNIVEFVRHDDIDGALVGGASLRAGEFIEIVRRTAEVKGVG